MPDICPILIDWRGIVLSLRTNCQQLLCRRFLTHMDGRMHICTVCKERSSPEQYKLAKQVLRCDDLSSLRMRALLTVEFLCSAMYRMSAAAFG